MHFVAFLKQVVAAYPTGVLYLALDSAPAHITKVVDKWLVANPRVKVLWLPKYSAHKHNPVERVWRSMKITSRLTAWRAASRNSSLVPRASSTASNHIHPRWRPPDSNA